MPNRSTTFAYISDVDVSFGGVEFKASEIRVTRRAERQFDSEADDLGNNVDSYNPDQTGEIEVDIPISETEALQFMNRKPEAVDAAGLAGGNIATASPQLPFSGTETSSGTIYASPFARVAGHPTGMGYARNGQKVMTYVIRCTPLTIRQRGYAQGA